MIYDMYLKKFQKLDIVRLYLLYQHHFRILYVISTIHINIFDYFSVNLKLNEIKKEEISYIEIISSEKFWQFLYQTDFDVRKNFYELIENISNKWPGFLLSY